MFKQVKNLNLLMSYGTVIVSVMLYADDENEEPLQLMLNKLHSLCNQYKMQINQDETKIDETKAV